MNESLVIEVCEKHLGKAPQAILRCSTGHGNYVFIVDCSDGKFVLRFSEEQSAYQNTAHWLTKLGELQVPVPEVVAIGEQDRYSYLVLTYLEGEDIGDVYAQLDSQEKKNIAHEVAEIQKKVSGLKLEDIDPSWSWRDEVNEMLDRSAERIVSNGYFDVRKVETLREESKKLDGYFDSIKPTAYLDDISTKNLLVCDGHVSGVIDVDWIGVGDKLTFAALTRMALLNMECDTDYVTYLLEEMQLSAAEKRAFVFYTLMFCVDFMGERGMQFLDKRIAVDEQIVNRLNDIYNNLWYEWTKITWDGGERK